MIATPTQIAQRKGEAHAPQPFPRTCACGAPFLARSGRQYRCPACQERVNVARKKAYNEAVRRPGGSPGPGLNRRLPAPKGQEREDYHTSLLEMHAVCEARRWPFAAVMKGLVNRWLESPLPPGDE